MEEIKISNRQIALMAFDRLRKEDKTDSALKLARCMLHGTSISLGIGDIDWEIDRAIQQCGGVLEKPLYFDPFGQTEFTPLAII